jgi:hypothetical protein
MWELPRHDPVDLVDPKITCMTNKNAVWFLKKIQDDVIIIIDTVTYRIDSGYIT